MWGDMQKDMQRDPEARGPPSWVGWQVFWVCLLLLGGVCFGAKILLENKCLLGRRGGVSPWLIAILDHPHLDLPQSVLHFLPGLALSL
jgi:hypothetical protein